MEGQVGGSVEICPGGHGGKVEGSIVVGSFGVVGNIAKGVMDFLVSVLKDVLYLRLPEDLVLVDLDCERLRALFRPPSCKALAAPRAAPDPFELAFRDRPRLAALPLVAFPAAFAFAFALAGAACGPLPLAPPRALPDFFLPLEAPVAPFVFLTAAGALPPDEFFAFVSCCVTSAVIRLLSWG